MAAPSKIIIKIHGVITWLKIEWQKSLERYFLKIVGLICTQFHEKPTLNPVMKLCIDTCLSCGVMIYPWSRKGSQRYKIRTSNMLNFFLWPDLWTQTEIFLHASDALRRDLSNAAPPGSLRSSIRELARRASNAPLLPMVLCWEPYQAQV